MSRVPPGWDVALVATAKALVSIAMLAAGFVALSDDDYSRTVIAERFAVAPSLDPSGTSWLPLPFFVHGGAMMLFGRSLATAHGVAVLSGVAAALCIHRAALWIGLSRAGAVLAAVIATGTLTAARLGVCPQPEALTAGFVTLGAAASLMDGSRRVAGAVALLAASLCRYEAWAAAALFAGFAVWDAAHAPSPEHRQGLLASAVLALLAPAAWAAHGAVSYGDALFFLHRVAAYRRAVGATEPLAASILAYPAALFRSEPEVTLAAFLVVRIAADRAPRALLRLARPSLVVGGLFALLVAGRALDGAPTHHAERTLLPVFSLFSVLVAEGIVQSLTTARGRPRGDAIARTMPVLLGLALVSSLLRAGRRPESFAPRPAERALGLSARRELAPEDRLLVDTSDYGYFAVIAAFGAPERAEPVDPRDPREPPKPDVFTTPDGVRHLLEQKGARWMVVQNGHVASTPGTVVDVAGELSLVRVLR